MKEQPLQLDPQSVLEQVFAMCGRFHPAVRYSLGPEARRLWRSFGIAQSIPKIVEERPRASAARGLDNYMGSLGKLEIKRA